MKSPVAQQVNQIYLVQVTLHLKPRLCVSVITYRANVEERSSVTRIELNKLEL
jgi:hypothetical protein